MLQSLLMLEINHTRHMKHFGRLSVPNVAKNLYFGGLTFRRKIKSMESSRNLKFAHNVDSDMIKIICEWNYNNLKKRKYIGKMIKYIYVLVFFLLVIIN